MGAAEVGIASQYFVDKDVRITTATVPVGYPTDDIKLLLLDEEGKEVGLGNVGEIVVKSSYLSPGYWANRVSPRLLSGRTRKEGPIGCTTLET